MTAAPAIRRFTRWDLDTLRAGKAVRDEHGEVIAELDALLEAAEAQFAAGTHSREVERPEADKPARPSPSTASAHRVDAPTDKQLAMIARLCDQLGRDADDRPEPRNKREASGIIDGLMAQAKHARRNAPRMATERQIELLRNLVAERQTPVDPERAEEITPESTPFALASSLIESWISLPRRAQVKPAHGIRPGYYAHSIDGGRTADHYRVRQDGVIRVWTAAGERPYNGKLNAALEWIKANPREAAALFGRLVEICGRCGRPLSDDDSRARGLGPVCATKTEW